MSETSYYVRFRGAVKGPYYEDEIRQMLEAGELSRYHQISSDEITWKNLGQSKLLAMPADIPKIKPIKRDGHTSGVAVVPSNPIPQNSQEEIPGPKPVSVANAAPVQSPQGFQADYPQMAQPFNSQPMMVYAQPPRTSGMAVTSFVLSMLGVSLLGVIFGHIAISQIDTQPTQLAGRGLAVAGLVIGYIGLALLLFGYLFFLIGMIE